MTQDLAEMALEDDIAGNDDELRRKPFRCRARWCRI